MRLGLGTAQFGFDYGVSNTGGRIPHNEVVRILDDAERAGIEVLDTAAVYGESEEVLGAALRPGHPFRVVTKTPAFSAPRISAAEIAEFRASFERSLSRLRQPRLYGLLAHSARDLLKPGGEALWDAMLELKRKNLVEKIGASVYSGAEIDAVLARYSAELVQLPLNLLDQRLMQDGYLAKLKNLAVEIHARSVFLQGLLLMKFEQMPAYFRPFEPELSRYGRFLQQQQLSPLQGALLFIRSIEQVDVALLGVTSRAQMHECSEIFRAARTGRPDFAAVACRNESLLNPAAWPTQWHREGQA